MADMEALKQSDAEIYGEFLSGNWVVNKNLHVPFCAVGADHALEHINRPMEVSAGLVGITLNPSARTVMSCSTWSPRQSCLSTDLCRQSKLGQQLFDDFVTSRIITNTANLWALMKKMSAANLESRREESEAQPRTENDGAQRRPESLCPLAICFQVTTRDKPRRCCWPP